MATKRTGGGKPAPNTKAPAGSYALPTGGPGGTPAYPINTPGRARSALARAAANEPPATQAKIRKAVEARYPDMKVTQPGKKAK